MKHIDKFNDPDCGDPDPCTGFNKIRSFDLFR
jgi:hypothetical protein